ncbi:MAG TPA: DUF2723 domain-containing protein [Chloroflexi bacterium]|nr:DUF2723 domain-containing protein [Chloroflexota bacterium]
MVAPVSDRPLTGTGWAERLFPALVFAVVFALYGLTAAPGVLFGDPSEYQFVPAVLGIAHPPGYAFYILLAKLWQILVPVGTVAWRANLLSAAVGAGAVTGVYLIVRELVAASSVSRIVPRGLRLWAPLFAALSLATATDVWQHGIHANAHIVSAALVVVHLWLLIRWWRTGRDRWLGLFGVAVGLSVTHHPITLMGLPAYGLFILAVRPRLLCQGRVLLMLAGCALLGLAPLLYYPWRSPSVPFGPTDMRTWEGFWGHVTAQGLRINLFHFGLADQLDRALVFWSLLRLQFALPVIALLVVGLLWLVQRLPKPALLLGSFLACHLLFTLNTVQDVMAYLLIPFAALSIAAGVGVLAPAPLWDSVSKAGRGMGWAARVLFVFLVLLWPFVQAVTNLQRGISLRDFTAAENWVTAVHRRFAGTGEGAALLAAWEYLTPLWVHAYTQDGALDEEDVALVYVSTAIPWAEAVWRQLEQGREAVYVPDYRPALREAGFRLLPERVLYRVVVPPAADAAPEYPLDVWADDRVRILGYDLPSQAVRVGEPLTLILYQSVTEPLAGIWMPYARLGSTEARWTTDSRLLTTEWLPGEIVAERYELPVPFTLPPGEYALHLGYADLSGGRAELLLSTGRSTVELETIKVLPNSQCPAERVLEGAVANLGNQVALLDARARSGWRGREAGWEEPLAVRAGRPLHLTLTWHALTTPRDSYTVFIHLIDGAGRPVLGHDYTPLGGACPTYLWFPKWLPGQSFIDPYRLVVPADLSPGDYWLEVGLYGMTSLRRLPVVDLTGHLAGDRVILGPVRVE